MKSRVKRAAVVVIVNSILIVLGILLVELALGGWIRPDALNRLNIIRSRTIKLNVGGLYDWPTDIVTYTRDDYGLRGTFQNPSEIDILTVGGSTTDQRFINDGYTWQDVIQQEFREIGKDVVVANAGVDGQSTFGHIANFDWWFPNIPGLKPKFILFYVGINDFHVEGASKFDEFLPDAAHPSVRQILRERSVLYHFLRTIHGAYVARFTYKLAHLARDFSQVGWTTVPLQPSYEELMSYPLRGFAERLEILIRRTRGFGSAPIFVTQPTRWYRFRDGVMEGTTVQRPYAGLPINGVDYYRMIRMLDEVMISVCANENVPCFDMEREIAWEDDDFYDFNHMNPKGARKVGEYLAGRLMADCPGLLDAH